MCRVVFPVCMYLFAFWGVCPPLGSPPIGLGVKGHVQKNARVGEPARLPLTTGKTIISWSEWDRFVLGGGEGLPHDLRLAVGVHPGLLLQNRDPNKKTYTLFVGSPTVLGRAAG